MIKKQKKMAFGKVIYLLGHDKNGINYWLEAPTWDCKWYWGLGHVETYTNNRSPSASKDIMSHDHFKSMFFDAKVGYDCFDTFKAKLTETPLTDKEIWQLLDYMKTCYALQEVARIYTLGDSHISSDAHTPELKNEVRADTINKELLPMLFKKIEEILSPQGVR